MGSSLYLDAKFIGRLVAAFHSNGHPIAISMGKFGMLDLVSQEIAIQHGTIHLPLKYRPSTEGKSYPVRLVLEYDRLENSVIWLKVTRFGPLKSESSIRVLLSTVFHFCRANPVIIHDGPRLGLPLAILDAVWPVGEPPEIVGLAVTDQVEVKIK